MLEQLAECEEELGESEDELGKSEEHLKECEEHLAEHEAVEICPRTPVRRPSSERAAPRGRLPWLGRPLSLGCRPDAPR